MSLSGFGRETRWYCKEHISKAVVLIYWLCSGATWEAFKKHWSPGLTSRDSSFNWVGGRGGERWLQRVSAPPWFEGSPGDSNCSPGSAPLVKTGLVWDSDEKEGKGSCKSTLSGVLPLRWVSAFQTVGLKLLATWFGEVFFRQSFTFLFSSGAHLLHSIFGQFVLDQGTWLNFVHSSVGVLEETVSTACKWHPLSPLWFSLCEWIGLQGRKSEVLIHILQCEAFLPCSPEVNRKERLSCVCWLSVEIFHGKRKGILPLNFFFFFFGRVCHLPPPNFWQVRLEIDLQGLLTLASQDIFCLLAAD